MRLFPRIDPRIAGALREQRRDIRKGLICVGISALLTASVIPLTAKAVEAISAAAPSADDSHLAPYEKHFADSLARPLSEVRAFLEERAASPAGAPLAEELVSEFGVSPETAARAIESLPPVASESVKKPEPTRSFRIPILEAMPPLQRLGVICLLVVVVFGLKYTFTRGQSYFLTRAANRLAADLRVRLYGKLLRLPISFFGKNKVGGIQSVLTNDINVYQNAVSMIRDSIDGPFKAIAALIFILTLNWQLALIALLFIGVMAWFVNRNGRRMKADQAQVQNDLAELNGFTSEALGGTRVIKAFAAEERMQGFYRDRVEVSFFSQMRAARRFAALRPMVELIGACSLATLLYLCGHLAQAGQLQISDIVALTLALDTINQGARAMSNVNNTYNQVQAAADRIYSVVLDVPEEALSEGGRALSQPKGRIEFDQVGFEYEDGTWALRGVSFVLEPGTSLALVGPSGAGKSTLADLLLRFYDPTEGRILLDGVDIREFDLRAYRQLFGVVPQSTFLFAGSIAENIRLGAPSATDDELKDAARMAHADAFIDRDAAGYQAILGERGSRISGGEGQRLAIARALVRKPTLLLLDEATSNLDAESERVVTEALDEVMHRTTTLFIVHRLTSAMRADRVLVLRRGEVVESGPPQELLERNGAFAAMYRTFVGGLSE